MAQTEVGIRLTATGDRQVVSALSGVEQQVERLTGAIAKVGHYGSYFIGLQQVINPSIRGLVDMADAYATLTGRIKLASEGLGNAAQAQKQLFDIANTARTSVDGLSNTYASLARAAGESGRSQAELLRTTDTLAKAMTISGGAAESQKAALMQFAQGLSAGTLRGEELNSVMEQAPRLAKALADGLGVPIGALKTMAEQGRITADAIFEALERSRAKIEQEFSQLPTTIGQALTVLNNSFMQTIGVFDETNKISSGFADAILGIGKNMDVVVPTVGAMAAGLVVLRTSATAAALATGALGTAVSALGGPIGLIATALGVGATAWMAWKGAATESEKAVETQVINSDAEIQARIDAQIGKLRERNRLAVAGMPEARSGVERAAADAGDLYARQLSRYQQIQSGAGEFAGLPDGTRAALLQASAKSLAKAYSQYTELTAEVATQAETKNRESFLNFTKGYKSAQDKAKEELAKYEKEFKPKIGIGITKSEYDAGYKAIEERTKKTTAATNRLNTEYEQQQKLLAELSGLSGSFAQDWDNLSKIYAKGGLSLDGLTAAQAALLEKQPAMKAAADEEKKAQEVLTRAYQEAAAERIKIAQSMEQSAVSAAEQNQSLRDEIELIGLTEEHQTRVLQQRNESIILTKEATLAELERASAITGTMTREQIALAAEIEALKERNELLGAKSVKNTAAEAAKKAEDEWKKTTDQINESLTDALMRGFESGKDFAKNMRDTVVNMFKTMVLRPVISAVVNPVAGAITGALGLSGTANAATAGLSSLGSLGTIWNAGSSALSSIGSFLGVGGAAATGLGLTASAGAGLGLASAGGGLGLSLGGTGLGISAGSAGAGAIGGSLGSSLGAGAASSGGAMSALGTAAPYLGAALAIYSIAKSFDNSGTPHMGAAAIYANGGIQEGPGLYGQDAFKMGHPDEYNANAQPGITSIAQGLGIALDSVAVSFGQKAGYEVATAFADDSSKDGAWGSLRISKEGKDLLNWENTRQSRWAPREFGDGEEGYKQYLAAVAKDTRQVLLDMDLPGWADTVLNAIGESPSIESLSAALAQIGQAQTVFKSFGQYMTTFATLADSSVTKLAAASGGIGALAGNMSTFVDQFYSDSEKLAVNTANLSEAMGKLGFDLPATRDEFKALVQAQLALGDAGAATAAGLLGLSGAFASIVPAADAVTESVKAMTTSLDDYISSNVRDSAQARYLRGLEMVGNTSALKRLGIPGYASGGYHPGGARMVGERGREIEITGPSMILSNPITEAIMGRRGNDGAASAAVVDELRGLRSGLDNLRAEVRAVVVQTAKAADIWERVTPGRNSISIATPYGPVQVATPSGKPLAIWTPDGPVYVAAPEGQPLSVDQVPA